MKWFLTVAVLTAVRTTLYATTGSGLTSGITGDYHSNTTGCYVDLLVIRTQRGLPSIFGHAFLALSSGEHTCLAGMAGGWKKPETCTDKLFSTNWTQLVLRYSHQFPCSQWKAYLVSLQEAWTIEGQQQWSLLYNCAWWAATWLHNHGFRDSAPYPGSLPYLV